MSSSLERTMNNYFVERRACPVCQATHLVTLFEAPYTDHRVKGHVMSHYRKQGTVRYDLLEDIVYTIHKCLKCDLIFQRMVPAQPMLNILYNEFIDPDKLLAAEVTQLTSANFYEVGRRLGDLFRTIGKEPKDITLLDFGFGYGRWARVAVAMGARVYATEIGPAKIAFAKSIGVQIIPEDTLEDHRFDVVHTEQVFEHLTHPAEVFAYLARCVASGGVFKIAVPRQGRIERLLRRYGLPDFSPAACNKGPMDYNTIFPLEHVNSFCRKPIEFLAQRAGFVVRTGGFGSRHLDFDVGSARSLIASSRQWGIRLAKDLYVRIGPGVRDNGYYLLYRR